MSGMACGPWVGWRGCIATAFRIVIAGVNPVTLNFWAAPRRLLSRDLLAQAQEVIIVHEGEEYRLRCTSKGKLILTK